MVLNVVKVLFNKLVVLSKLDVQYHGLLYFSMPFALLYEFVKNLEFFWGLPPFF